MYKRQNWVWASATCLGPSYQRCLVSLSRGGADATVVREFDTVDKCFVEGGFQLPEAKSSVEWQDADTLYVATDFGAGSLSEAGYPRIIKRWHRGQPLADAVTVFEAGPQDIFAWVSVDHTPGFERTVFGRASGFYSDQQFLLQGQQLLPIDKPEDAKLAFWREHLLLELRSDWVVAGKTWPRGALLLANAAAYLQGERQFTALFTPSATRSLAHYTATRSRLLLSVLDNVASRLEEWHLQDGTWRRREVDAPYPGQLSAQALHDPLLPDDPLAEHYLLNAADFLQPDSLQLGRTGSDERDPLKARPSFFDANGMRAEQRFATSADGTSIPYFVIWPQGAKADGRNPTLLYGYGGFEVSKTPFYSGAMGLSLIHI